MYSLHCVQQINSEGPNKKACYAETVYTHKRLRKTKKFYIWLGYWIREMAIIYKLILKLFDGKPHKMDT